METQVKKSSFSTRLNRVTTLASVVVVPTLMSVAHAADDNTINIGSLGVTGLTTAAASVFAIKAGPSLMMWGYRKVLGFIGR